MAVDGNGRNLVNPEDYRMKVAELVTTLYASKVAYDNLTPDVPTLVVAAKAILLASDIVMGDQPA